MQKRYAVRSFRKRSVRAAGKVPLCSDAIIVNRRRAAQSAKQDDKNRGKLSTQVNILNAFSRQAFAEFHH